MSTLERAIAIAADGHAGVTDKGGAPYILHPLRMMLSLSSPDERIVAVLHDVCEDCEGWTLDRLRDEGFPPHTSRPWILSRNAKARITKPSRSVRQPIPSAGASSLPIWRTIATCLESRRRPKKTTRASKNIAGPSNRSRRASPTLPLAAGRAPAWKYEPVQFRHRDTARSASPRSAIGRIWVCAREGRALPKVISQFWSC
jgi:hypothetical protein